MHKIPEINNSNKKKSYKFPFSFNFRCRNTCIVGGEKQNLTKQGVISSRGSSGIGSDLAPSPERQDAQSSSGKFKLIYNFIINQIVG